MSKLHDMIHERFLLILLLLFILSSTIAYALASDAKMIVDLVIDIFWILVGIISIFLILNITKSFKGALKQSFNYIIYGISFQILALVDHALRDYGIVIVPMDIHHVLMGIGIIFFTMSAFKLRNMLAELK